MAEIDDSVKKKVPELRFKGFTDDWEERKLSDIADRFDNLRVPITASDRKPGDTPYYGANGIQDYVEGFTHNGEFILVAEDGANDLKNYPVQYVNGKVWVNNHAHVLQGKKTITDNKFLMNAIKNFNIEPFLVGGGRAKLNADVMMKLNILLQLIDKLSNFYNIKIRAQPTVTGWFTISINNYSVELPLPDIEENSVDVLSRFNILDTVFPEKSLEELVAKSLVPNPCFKLDDYEVSSVYIDFINKTFTIVMDGFLYSHLWTNKYKLKEQLDLIQSSGMVDGKELK